MARGNCLQGLPATSGSGCPKDQVGQYLRAPGTHLLRTIVLGTLVGKHWLKPLLVGLLLLAAQSILLSG